MLQEKKLKTVVLLFVQCLVIFFVLPPCTALKHIEEKQLLNLLPFKSKNKNKCFKPDRG